MVTRRKIEAPVSEAMTAIGQTLEAIEVVGGTPVAANEPVAPVKVAPVPVETPVPAPELKQYRCTRPSQYPNPELPGHRDTWARMGDYILATCEADARAKMSERYPDDDGDFTVEPY